MEGKPSPSSSAVLELTSPTSEMATLTDRAQAARQMIAINRLLTLGRSAREGSLAETLKTRRGEKIPLPFPFRRPTYLIVCAPGEIDRNECDVGALMSLNLSVGHLDIVGFLDDSRDVQGSDRCIFLMSPVTAVFLYDPSSHGGLYRLSYTIFDFVKCGLTAFDGIYRPPYVEPVIVAQDDPRRPLPRDVRRIFGSSVADLHCRLAWPENFTFVFGVPHEQADDSALLSESQSAYWLRDHIVVFGHFGPAHARPEDRVPVYIGEDEAVYCFHRGISRLLRLAENLEMFYRLGIKRFFKNDRVVPSRLGDDMLFLQPD